MAAPFTFTGVLTFPADPGGAGTPISINFANNFSQIVAETLALSGSGSKTIDLSALNGGTGATALLVKVDSQVSGTPPVFLKVNAETVGEEIQPGGAKLVLNPSPAAGITQLVVEYTGIATVRIWALG